jgi:hypothetical protein
VTDDPTAGTDASASAATLAAAVGGTLDRAVVVRPYDLGAAADRARAFYERHGFEPWGETVARGLRGQRPDETADDGGVDQPDADGDRDRRRERVGDGGDLDGALDGDGGRGDREQVAESDGGAGQRALARSGDADAVDGEARADGEDDDRDGRERERAVAEVGDEAVDGTAGECDRGEVGVEQQPDADLPGRDAGGVDRVERREGGPTAEDQSVTERPGEQPEEHARTDVLPGLGDRRGERDLAGRGGGTGRRVRVPVGGTGPSARVGVGGGRPLAVRVAVRLR